MCEIVNEYIKFLIVKNRISWLRHLKFEVWLSLSSQIKLVMDRGEVDIKTMISKQRSNSWGWYHKCGGDWFGFSLAPKPSVWNALLSARLTPASEEAKALLTQLPHKTKKAEAWKSVNTEFKSCVYRLPKCCSWPSSLFPLKQRFLSYKVLKVSVLWNCCNRMQELLLNAKCSWHKTAIRKWQPILQQWNGGDDHPWKDTSAQRMSQPVRPESRAATSASPMAEAASWPCF